MRKQRLIAGILLVLLIAGFEGCLKRDTTDDFGYLNKSSGFGLNPPKNWTALEMDPTTNIAVQFIGPLQSDNTHVILRISTPLMLPSEVNLTTYADQMITQMEEQLSVDPRVNFTLISRNERTVNGLSAYEMVSTTFFNDTTSGIYTKQERKIVLIEKNRKTFILTYLTSPDYYDMYLSVFEESLKSFTII